MRDFSQKVFIFRQTLKKLPFFAAAAFFMLLTSYNMQAQIIAFETGPLAGNEATLNSTTTAANLNTSVLSRGAGINADANANSFNSNGFTGTTANPGTIADAIAANEFLQFTISPQSGFRVSLSTLDANFRRSGTGPNTFQFQFSLDGFATAGVNIGSAFTFTGTTTAGAAQTQINLSNIPELQNVASPTVITIRLFAAGATSGAGAFGIGELAGNDLAIGGTVAPVGPTAAMVNVGGRVTNSKGRGISRALVTMTDGNGNNYSAYTNSLGYYLFEEVEVGQTLIFNVNAKSYIFTQPTQVVSLSEETVTVNFTGYSSRRSF